MMCDESAEEGLGREWSVGITSFTPLPEQLEADVALNMLSSSLSSRREGGRAAPKRQEITRAEPKRSTSYLWFDGAPAAMQTSYISHATWYAFRGDDAWILIQDKLHPGVLSSPKNEFGAAAGCRLSTLGQELELLGGSAPEDIEPFTTRVNNQLRGSRKLRCLRWLKSTACLTLPLAGTSPPFQPVPSYMKAPGYRRYALAQTPGISAHVSHSVESKQTGTRGGLFSTVAGVSFSATLSMLARC